jgi:hypothetical protein
MMEDYMGRVGGFALMALIVLAKVAAHVHGFYALERVSVRAYRYVTAHNAHKGAVDPKAGHW